MRWLVVVLCGWAVIAAGCAKTQPTNYALWKFEEYETQTYPDFKAFAFDPVSNGWGIGFGYLKPGQAIEAALRRCGKRGVDCEIYALGNTIVSRMSQEQLATATEAYGARIWGDVDRSLKRKPLTSDELKQHLSGWVVKGTLITGAAFVAEIRTDGIVSARLSSTERQSLGKLRRADLGPWWIERGKFCWQFIVWYDGRPECQNVVKDGKTFKFYSSGELVAQGVVVGAN